jgi:UDP-N-acetylmuramoyl-tripeptide--D-alanyl-D-alanine ligase
MMKFIHYVFPYRLYLHIFQLERYDLSRALPWVFSHFFQRSHQNKKPLVVTDKIKHIRVLSFIWFVVLLIVGFLITSYLGVIIGLVLILQPYLLIILAIWSLKPYEIWNRANTIRKTQQKILSLKHTKVIGIAGSYGKTSVKDILYHLLKKDFKVLKTPLSYNTIFGIAQVVDLELDDSYDFFLCELGEFQKGDIVEMCKMVHPSYGIMTGINNQHLERFKVIENTIATIFELFDYLKKKSEKTVANFTNDYIKTEASKRNATDTIISYGDKESNTWASDVVFSDNGTSFILHTSRGTAEIQPPLLGNAHVNNILGAVTMALELGVSLQNIVEQTKTLPQVPHRFAQTLLPNGYLLIDNSYSSNTDSFREALAILAGLDRKNKILVTPGMVELGTISNEVHTKLGQQAAEVCTQVILVGVSERTKSLEEGIGSGRSMYMNDIRSLWQTISELGYEPKDTAILLENDLPDNY